MNISTDISLVKMGRKQWQPPHRPNGSSVGKSRSHVLLFLPIQNNPGIQHHSFTFHMCRHLSPQNVCACIAAEKSGRKPVSTNPQLLWWPGQRRRPLEEAGRPGFMKSIHRSFTPSWVTSPSGHSADLRLHMSYGGDIICLGSCFRE